MKKQTKQKLIYLRYILPPLLLILVLAMMFIPSYRFVTDGKADGEISAFSLLENSFELSRKVLFGGEEQGAANIIFARMLLAYIIIVSLLCIAAVCVSVWCAVVAVRYFADDDEERAERSRTMFVTFIPNRIVLSAVQMLVLPVLAFPYIMSPLYQALFATRVVVILCAPEPFFTALTVLTAIFVFSAICKGFEKDFDVDLFKKRKKASENYSETEENYADDSNFASNKNSDEIKQRNERIRQLLNNDKKDTDDE